MMEQYDISGLRKGDVRTGTVIAETENGWLVDVGYKCEGYLPGKEWTHRILVGDAEKPKKGDEIEVQVINLREGEEAQRYSDGTSFSCALVSGVGALLLSANPNMPQRRPQRPPASRDRVWHRHRA